MSAGADNADLNRLELILGEIRYRRQRQVDHHGWTPAHDDQHTDRELARAAITYIQAACNASLRLTEDELQVYWPWEPRYWPLRPESQDAQREGLLNACALLVAELERLDRRP